MIKGTPAKGVFFYPIILASSDFIYAIASFVGSVSSSITYSSSIRESSSPVAAGGSCAATLLIS